MEATPSKRATFIDAHFHFDLCPQPLALLGETEKAGVQAIAVTNAPSVFHHTLAVSKKHPCLLPAVGLHPELASSHGHELALMWPMLDQTRFVGEIGLDYVTNDSQDRASQKRVFSQIVERAASYGNKVLTVHSRRSAADVIAIIGNNYPGSVILHWFSGTPRELERALDAGYYFSIGPAMVKSKTGLSSLARLPRNRVLTETDGPFVEVMNRPARPSDIPAVVQQIGQIWGCAAEEATASVYANFSEITSSVPS